MVARKTAAMTSGLEQLMVRRAFAAMVDAAGTAF
jgi:hypothetical protein